ncbi:hypothetical protein NI389_19195 (plasmid) [Pseudoalteromonas xiamenensis]|uniref:hypothetical protein n=1 Tax=Pseudoalteromonas xiamenensis TaxID=882626 RepID=UPI0027E471C7|nr:hypothetical protein [Pseudoalteromonas xiamenensis]WMN61931.1 hypothetical protein NI389_19195 [Pseudoalteromonas xiamenensis]
MDVEHIEAQTLIHKAQKKQALIEEFEQLRPTWKGNILRTVSMFLSMALIVWMYPEIIHQPISYILLILVFGVSADLHAQSKRINQRIDTLHKLLKD